MQQHNQQPKIINEGLRPLDLENLIYPTMEIDTYKSKMGEDRDVCVVSFQVKDRSPAKDLMEFVEKGYQFVLDADVSSGENESGEYSVFIELERTERLSEQIKELTYGIRKLTGIEDFKFRYHKSATVHDVTEETINRVVPRNPNDYDGLMLRNKTESIKRFFNKTLMDDLTLENNIITIHKPFDKKIQLEMIEDQQENINENSEDRLMMDDNSISEVFWMTKVLGDYDIVKYGDHFKFTNGENTMTFKRI
jgi:hypothetical protein